MIRTGLLLLSVALIKAKSPQQRFMNYTVEHLLHWFCLFICSYHTSVLLYVLMLPLSWWLSSSSNSSMSPFNDVLPFWLALWTHISTLLIRCQYLNKVSSTIEVLNKSVQHILKLRNYARLYGRTLLVHFM